MKVYPMSFISHKADLSKEEKSLLVDELAEVLPFHKMTILMLICGAEVQVDSKFAETAEELSELSTDRFELKIGELITI